MTGPATAIEELTRKLKSAVAGLALAMVLVRAFRPNDDPDELGLY